MADKVVTQIYDSVLDPVTDALNLSGSTTKRFGVVAVATGAGLYAFKPSSMFSMDGSCRSWKITNPQDPSATYVTWWVTAAALGTAAALFL